MAKSPDEILRDEFNNWAEQGRGEEMERHHISIVEQTFRLMDVRQGDRILDLGCGTGWASRILARMVGETGSVVGLDVSDQMVRRARATSRDYENLMFVCASATEIPFQENFFTRVFSVESFYYYPDQERALAELVRVMAPKAQLYILINLYKENPYSLRWADALQVPVQARSEREYVEMLERHTFEDVQALHIPDLTPTPETYSGKWFKNADELREFKRIGALLLTARKGDFDSPPRAMEIY